MSNRTPLRGRLDVQNFMATCPTCHSLCVIGSKTCADCGTDLYKRATPARPETDCDFLQRVLADGREHNLNEILRRSFAERGVGLTIHSRASDLRKRGLNVVNWKDGERGNGSWYRLVGAGENPVGEAGALPLLPDAESHSSLSVDGLSGTPVATSRYLPSREYLTERCTVNDQGCWQWNLGLNNNGYGKIKRSNGKWIRAHRASYEVFVGPIPDGMQIDHLCRNRGCINPEHLEVVTQQENLRRGDSPVGLNARKTHCKRGHEFTPENTYNSTSGARPERMCRTCHRMRQRSYDYKRRLLNESEGASLNPHLSGSPNSRQLNETEPMAGEAGSPFAPLPSTDTALLRPGEVRVPSRSQADTEAASVSLSGPADSLPMDSGSRAAQLSLTGPAFRRREAA